MQRGHLFEQPLRHGRSVASLCCAIWAWGLVAGWIAYGLFEPHLPEETFLVVFYGLAMQTAIVLGLLAFSFRARGPVGRNPTEGDRSRLVALSVLLVTAGVMSIAKGERAVLERRTLLALANGDYAVALQLSSPRALKGDPAFQFLLYRIYTESSSMNRPEEAHAWLRRAAESGSQKAREALRGSLPAP